MVSIPQNTMLVPLLFLIYINDLTEGLLFIRKLFTDDTTLISVIRGIQTSVINLNKDLFRISKMNFNLETTKQALRRHF